MQNHNILEDKMKNCDNYMKNIYIYIHSKKLNKKINKTNYV